ncbi:MAG: ATP-binding protein [Candidatus Paceibacterota bacterium]
MIVRILENQIKEALFKGKIIVLYGARQVGKTTILKKIAQENKDQSMFLNCDELDVRQALTDKTSIELKRYLGDKKLILIDEAQRIRDIGLTLKLLIDTYPEIQVIASGSSSFDLANKVNEPLTGRKTEFFLFPISLNELRASHNEIEMDSLINHLLIRGSYPKVITSESNTLAETTINEITGSYLYKDILQFEGLKKPDLIEKLLQALAFQLGQEVSFTELSRLLNTNRKTIEKYVSLLEKAFVIFRLNPLSRNLRKEIGKNKKIYFYDLGVRNSIIQNFNEVGIRNDLGALWENFMVVERMKKNYYGNNKPNIFFWRTYDQKEIDYIEESGGKMSGFEFKWSDQKWKKPLGFLESYQDSTATLITKKNYTDFV